MQNAPDDFVELLQRAASQGRVVLILPESAPPAAPPGYSMATAAALCRILDLRPGAGKALAMLTERGFAATEDLHRAISPRGIVKSNSKTLHVTICRLRNQLRPHGIAIATDFGLGFRLEEADRDKIREMLADYGVAASTPSSSEAA